MTADAQHPGHLSETTNRGQVSSDLDTRGAGQPRKGELDRALSVGGDVGTVTLEQYRRIRAEKPPVHVVAVAGSAR